jgi:hypothetical protein
MAQSSRSRGFNFSARCQCGEWIDLAVIRASTASWDQAPDLDP